MVNICIENFELKILSEFNLGGRRGLMDRALSRRPGGPRFESRLFFYFSDFEEQLENAN